MVNGASSRCFIWVTFVRTDEVPIQEKYHSDEETRSTWGDVFYPNVTDRMNSGFQSVSTCLWLISRLPLRNKLSTEDKTPIAPRQIASAEQHMVVTFTVAKLVISWEAQRNVGAALSFDRDEW